MGHKEQVKDFYNQDSNEYDKRWLKRGGKKTAESQKRIISALIENWSEKQILELGCGSGRFSTQVIPIGGKTVLLDIAYQMLLVTRAKVSKTPYEFNGTNGSAYGLPFSDASFDASYSINVFNHFDNPISALMEINRVLKDKGLFLVNFANLNSCFWPIALYINHTNKSIGRNVYSVWLSVKQMMAMLHSAGFTIVKSVGNVYVPLYFDYPLIRELPLALDAISQNSALKWIAPSIFFLCRKDRSL